MKKFFYCSEGGRMNEIEADSALMAYRCIFYFYMPSTKIIIIDSETKQANVFIRKLDHNGNLIEIIKIF